MKRILGIVFITMAVVLFSCGNKQNEAMIKSVDSLYTAIKEVEKSVLMMDTADYYIRIQYTDEKSKQIQEKFNAFLKKEGREANLEESIFLSDIVASTRSFKKLLKKREEVIDDVLHSKGQLIDLKKDIGNNLVLPNSFKEYYNAEAKTISGLENTVEGLLSWGTSATTQHEKMKTQIDEFIQQIQ